MEEEQIIHARKLSASDAPESALEELFSVLGGFGNRFKTGDLVLIKPNFVAPFPRATTDLAFIDFFIKKIRQSGGVPIVGESSGYEFDTENTFKILGVRSFLEKRGVDLVNFEKHRYARINVGDGLPELEVAEVALECKLIVNLPVLKGHSITKVTGSVKNLFGLLSLDSRRKLHCKHLHTGIAALGKRFTNAMHFVDGRKLLTRAVFGEEQALNYCLAATNPFALDHFGAKLLSIDPDAVLYLQKVPQYSVWGDTPEFLSPLGGKNSFREKLHRTLYSAFYWIDEVKCKTLGGNSIIPSLHWSLGIHPAIGNVSGEELLRLAELCPVDAINAQKRTIEKDKCIKVRCLKCYHEATPGSIALKGLNKPRK
jgi:uncharacterized protein (DUF362 family)